MGVLFQNINMSHMRNPHLSSLQVDHILHLGLDSSMDLAKTFGDIKCVVLSGSNGRAKSFAERLRSEFGITSGDLEPVALTERYHVYKVKEVLCVSHGIGGPSITIILNEITKVLHYAGAKDFVYIRAGTSGGVGVPVGSLVITENVYNGFLEPYLEVAAAGQRRKRESKFSPELIQKLEGLKGELPVVLGNTLCCDDYYEAQARMDGVICDFDHEQRDEFLHRAHAVGVRNIEMESLVFGAFCYHTGIPCAMMAVALINRLEGDQVRELLTEEQLAEVSRRPYELIIRYLRHYNVLTPDVQTQ
eukprot:c12736_g1_i1.p1 GENE.c12736_g1_i1~~c12736_g1_i1.p1  ORF type:complete len:304 (-),score=74.55 c12736_g1_i1:16-927(-)